MLFYAQFVVRRFEGDDSWNARPGCRRPDLLIHFFVTSGAVCVELVRKIELSSWRVVEVGVHHYPRRFRSLLTTFRQLIALHWRLVAAPWLRERRQHAT